MYRAVVVDDEPWSLINIKSVFPWENYGFEQPMGFDNARDALNAVLQEKPDVLFTDIKMPEISGLELIQHVRGHNSKLKIVVTSGYANFSFAQQAISYGVFGYLLKPINRQDAEKLMMQLKTALDLEQKPTELEEKYTGISNPAFRKLLQYVSEHYREKLQLNELTKRFHINASYGSQLFHEHFGYGFTEYLTELKMQKATELLSSDMSATAVADFLNYEYVYFNKLFKKRFGMTPRQYRQKEGENE